MEYFLFSGGLGFYCGNWGGIKERMKNITELFGSDGFGKILLGLCLKSAFFDLFS